MRATRRHRRGPRSSPHRNPRGRPSDEKRPRSTFVAIGSSLDHDTSAELVEVSALPVSSFLHHELAAIKTTFSAFGEHYFLAAVSKQHFLGHIEISGRPLWRLCPPNGSEYLLVGVLYPDIRFGPRKTEPPPGMIDTCRRSTVSPAPP